MKFQLEQNVLNYGKDDWLLNFKITSDVGGVLIETIGRRKGAWKGKKTKWKVIANYFDPETKELSYTRSKTFSQKEVDDLINFFADQDNEKWKVSKPVDVETYVFNNTTIHNIH